MSEKQAELEQAVERIAGAIDRASSVSLSVQLRGALEFGIASGELPAGARLPSVRALAGRLKISPVTVSHVYSALQEAGHIEGRVGNGTFVSSSAASAPAPKLRELEDRIAELVTLGRECGLSPAELAMRVSMSTAQKRRNVRILMVGNFHDATESYAAELRPHLRQHDTLAAATLSEVAEAPPRDVDLIVAPRTLLPRLRELCPGTAIAGLTLIPNEATRVALASIPPDARVVAYSYFPGFVAIMKTGIQRFAPHVADLTMIVRDEPGTDAAIARADVLIYATGSEYLTEGLRPDQTACEYRHTPDVQAVRSELLPAIETCRTRLADTKEPAT
ncbi:GntR family transcriptional regulator [Tranquillimonas alkanivorans]|uniref:Transcriptional regulator, GntR family n=1 Tax=Tranquillimonas alkanivorans TaxID=441119 RepID=A0A1I5UVP7_9RHOB|nr:GntR family transcriptional regulator [Tranquillimonas alkanivorans]SFP98786.1 transcriptional regulator, GntR family [Tranquillimonas alkanivorans]